MLNTDKIRDIAIEVAKASPPTGATIYGWWNGLDWALITGPLTAIFIILQIAHLIWRWRRDSSE